MTTAGTAGKGNTVQIVDEKNVETVRRLLAVRQKILAISASEW